MHASTRTGNPIWLLLTAFGAYLVLQGLAALRANNLYAAAGLAVLGTVLLLPGLRAARWAAWVAWVVLLGMLTLAVSNGFVDALLDGLAVVINGFVGWVFARSLRAGHEPLITRMVRFIEDDARLEKPGVRRYTRALTITWAATMGGQAVLLLMAWWFLHVGWPLAASGELADALAVYLRYGSYAVVGLLFLLEHPWRRHCLPHVEHASFLVATRRVAASWRHMLRDDGKGGS